MCVNNIETILKEYMGLCLEEFVSELSIKIIEVEADQMPLKSDAMLLDSNIIIKRNIKWPYRNFLILHELGHFLLHQDGSIRFSSYLKLRDSKLEREANAFACRFLLADTNLNGVDVIHFLTNKGVPVRIATDYCECHRVTNTVNM